MYHIRNRFSKIYQGNFQTSGRWAFGCLLLYVVLCIGIVILLMLATPRRPVPPTRSVWRNMPNLAHRSYDRDHLAKRRTGYIGQREALTTWHETSREIRWR